MGFAHALFIAHRNAQACGRWGSLRSPPTYEAHRQRNAMVRLHHAIAHFTTHKRADIIDHLLRQANHRRLAGPGNMRCH